MRQLFIPPTSSSAEASSTYANNLLGLLADYAVRSRTGLRAFATTANADNPIQIQRSKLARISRSAVQQARRPHHP